tara:strand:+ start:850 stop:1209 length:360 start_codon:yes stop_codon:yes gene_type:complete
VTQETPTYPEDEEILGQLEDPTDIEAFSNLMENAHREGVSAADFIRVEPKRTSRKTIRKLCLKDQRRSIKAIVSSVVRSLWDRPAAYPEASLSVMVGPTGPRFGPLKKPATGEDDSKGS